MFLIKKVLIKILKLSLYSALSIPDLKYDMVSEELSHI